MRILMLAQFYAPVVGGEEQHVHDLSHWLAENGHDVAVATLWHDRQLHFESDRNVRVYRIRSTAGDLNFMFRDPQRHHATPFPDPGVMRGLSQVIERERPLIVHAHNWLVHSFLPLKRRSGARLVMTLHTYGAACVQQRLRYHDVATCSGPAFLKCIGCACRHYGVKGPAVVIGHRASGPAMLRGVDRFVAVSRAVAEGNGLERMGVEYEVIPNFIPAAQPDAADQTPWLSRLPPEDFVMFAGDLVPDKGFNVLLEAYRRLDKAPPLVCIGRTPSEVPPNLPSNIRMLGAFPHAAVMQAWHRSLFALVPSLWAEPFGLVALEAMSAGRPVIASRVGGLSDLIVDDDSGVLVQPADATALCNAIRRLLLDEGLRRRLANGARTRAAQFTADRVIPQIVKVYEELVDRSDHSSTIPISAAEDGPAIY
jgi:glycosyltransferase involved in cell wall biosynthesis